MGLDTSAFDDLFENVLCKNADSITEIVEQFLKETPQQLKDLKVYIPAKDYSKLKIISHTMKSHCAVLGAMKMKELCLHIEESSDEEKDIDYGSIVDELIEEYESISAELAKKLESIRNSAA